MLTTSTHCEAVNATKQPANKMPPCDMVNWQLIMSRNGCQVDNIVQVTPPL